MTTTPCQPPYVIGIDGGTEAIKAGLFDLQGNLVATGTGAYKTYFSRPGWAEQEPAEWWASLVAAVRECLKAAPQVNPSEIIGISADATCCTMVPMRADGTVLHRALLWMDVRASEQANRIYATGHAALRYCLSGVSAEWMPAKLLWLRENEREIYDQTDTLIEYTDWIAYRLTNRFALSISTINHRWFYHLPSGGWQPDFFETIGLGGLEAKFPKDVLKIGEIVGGLSPEAAEQLGLPAGIPVATSGADAFIGLLGLGVTSPGDMGVITGSSNVMSALSAHELHFPGIFGSFPDALIPGLNLIEGGQVSTGSILNWFKQNFGQGLAEEARAQGKSIYQLLDAEAAQIPPGSDGLIVLDYFQGNRTPHTDSAARGTIWGLSLQSSRAHVFRALMEGVAYGMRDILETFARNNFAVSRVIASGGATRSPVFMQIYADVLGLPLYTTRFPEATMLGSAVVAATGAGAYPSLVEASRQMVQVTDAYQPNPQRHADYAFFMRKYQQTYQQLKGLMQEMNRKLAL
ncbi:MAG: FGGY-family carbohydrate kinase [Chloroflexi bacterium]|nr:FGGY-family carbohydrate kinase [Chloroflexota bacterium]